MAEAEDREREARALFSLLGQAHGLDGLGGIEFEPAERSITTLTGASQIPMPQQLQVFAKVARESSTAGNLPGVALDEWADTILPQSVVGSDRGATREAVLNALRQSEPGKDPLGRADPPALAAPPGLSDPSAPSAPPAAPDPFDPAHLLGELHLDEYDTFFKLLPKCDATAKTIDSYLALSVSTISLTRKPFAAFEPIVNPSKWPGCWLQSSFFQSMNFVRPPQGPPGDAIPLPEQGWKGKLEEVVDWSLGFGQPDEMHTELDFRYVWPEPGASAEQSKRGACTYDLVRSVDGKVAVDQGYLLVEDLGPPHNARRFQTLKQVFLTHPPVKVEPGDLCGFWSFVSGLIQQGC